MSDSCFDNVNKQSPCPGKSRSLGDNSSSPEAIWERALVLFAKNRGLEIYYGMSDGPGFGVGDGLGFGVGDGLGFGVSDGLGFGVSDGPGFGVSDGLGVGDGLGLTV